MSQTVQIGQPNHSGGGYYQSPVAFEEKALVFAGRGLVSQIMVANKNAAVVYLWLYDSATAATSNTLICPPIPVPISGLTIVAEHAGMPFLSGIYFAASSTLATYTPLTTSDVSVHIQYGVGNR